MSDTDSFIDEVTEEVKRDRLFALMRKWGWVPVLVVVLIVGGTAWREYQIASAANKAQAFGDSVLEALDGSEPEDRVGALEQITSDNAGASGILQLLIAAEEGTAGNDAEAVKRLRSVADNPEIPNIYRQIATYKALSRGSEILSIDERRAGFDVLAVPGQPLRLLAEEQLALIDIETGERDAALERLLRMVEDSEATAGLRQRASQLIVALGGSLDET